MIEPTRDDIGRAVKVAAGDAGPLEGTLRSIGRDYLTVRLGDHDVPVPRRDCDWAGAPPPPKDSPRAVAARSVFAAAGMAIVPDSRFVWRVAGYEFHVEGGQWTSPGGSRSGLNASELVKDWRATGGA